MNENSVVSLRQKDDIDDPLTEILRTGARRLITRRLRSNSIRFLPRTPIWPFGRASASFATDMIRSHDPDRDWPVKVQKRRPAIVARGGWRAHSLHVFDPTKMGAAHEEPRRAPAALYLRGISAGDFQEVLTALLGKDAPNLSPQ